jgi:FkbM family methyltransferase
MNLKYQLGRIAGWPMERLMRARWFPLFGTYRLRTSWLYDVCRIAGTRKIRSLFDVGANIGQTALDMNRYFPKADIHSFEPIDGTFLELRRNVSHLKNVHPHQLALGRSRGSIAIEIQDCSELNSLRFAAKASSASKKVQRVEIETLDQFCLKHGIDSVDVLKTDAQGADLEVMEGGDGLLSSNRVGFIYAEVSFQPDDPDNTHFAEFDAYLLTRGYRLFGFYEQFGGVRDGRGYLQFCNALYVHSETVLRRFGRAGAAPTG